MQKKWLDNLKRNNYKNLKEKDLLLNIMLKISL